MCLLTSVTANSSYKCYGKLVAMAVFLALWSDGF